MKFTRYLALFVVLLTSAALLACGKSSGSPESGGSPATGASGAVSVSLTDAPGDFDHVWVTVKDIWFHLRDDADPRAADWKKFPLPAPATIDLLTLSNGGNGVNNGIETLWSGLALTAGIYKQIRIVLVDTTDPMTASATAKGISYNNEVVIGGNESPLYIPDARHGIGLIGSFNVVADGTLNLAIDFDAGEDIVEFHDGDYVLKPRLAFFDLDKAGAIIGKIDLASGNTVTSGKFVVKAEQLSADGSHHVVRRWTVPDPVTGKFVLYPLTTAATTTYDVLIRGLNYQTVIIKGVPAGRGTTPSSGGGATDMGTITITQTQTPSLDYAVNASIASPTGAWVNFYQTLTGSNEVPYEVRFRHFAPLTGKFAGFQLSNMPISVGTYTSGTMSFSTNTPLEGIGGYTAVADALLFDSSSPVAVTAPTGTVAALTIPALTVSSPYVGNQVTGSITMSASSMNNTMDRGVLFAVHRGMIVNAINIGTDIGGGGQMVSGGTYSIASLPGGSAATPLPGAFYGIEAVGWNHLTPRLRKAIGVPQIVDLRSSDDTAAMLMIPF
jgi:uncharacterized protein DUF4382